jgi:hypothetical protein
MLEEVKEPDDPLYIPLQQIPMPITDDMPTLVKNGILKQWEVDFCERLAVAGNFPPHARNGTGPQVQMQAS